MEQQHEKPVIVTIRVAAVVPLVIGRVILIVNILARIRMYFDPFPWSGINKAFKFL